MLGFSLGGEFQSARGKVMWKIWLDGIRCVLIRKEKMRKIGISRTYLDMEQLLVIFDQRLESSTFTFEQSLFLGSEIIDERRDR